MTRMSGRKAASASRNVRHAEKASVRSDDAVLPGREPTSGASCATSQSRSASSTTRLHCLTQLVIGLLGPVRFEDAGLGYDLAQGPEGDTIAVGQAPAMAQ